MVVSYGSTVSKVHSCAILAVLVAHTARELNAVGCTCGAATGVLTTSEGRTLISYRPCFTVSCDVVMIVKIKYVTLSVELIVSCISIRKGYVLALGSCSFFSRCGNDCKNRCKHHSDEHQNRNCSFHLYFLQNMYQTSPKILHSAVR